MFCQRLNIYLTKTENQCFNHHLLCYSYIFYPNTCRVKQQKRMKTSLMMREKTKENETINYLQLSAVLRAFLLGQCYCRSRRKTLHNMQTR